MAQLVSHTYGKSAVRLVRVNKGSEKHEVKELSVSVLLEGDFDGTYFTGDNSKVVPTDTMKNTVYILAKRAPITHIEEFGMRVTSHFLKTYSQVSKVTVEIKESLWKRMEVSGPKGGLHPHNHAFLRESPELRVTRVNATRQNIDIESGIEDLLILKTTGSGFIGYDTKDPFTTLKPTTDRVMSSIVKAYWKFNTTEADFDKVWAGARQIIFDLFANTYSGSVQQTIFQIGSQVIETFGLVDEVTIMMPNKHVFPYNLEPFHLDNSQNEVCVPFDDPHGNLMATIRRQKARL